MPNRKPYDRLTFLSCSPAQAADRRLTIMVGAASAIIFAIVAPFAKVQLPAVWAFIPSYQSALATSDLITAILLYAQFRLLRSRALMLLASGYLFTALMAIVHTLTFPGVFAPAGLLGAGPQTTAWLYMFWHGGFPLLVIGYGLLKDREASDQPTRMALILSIALVSAAVAALTWLATVGGGTLPPIMSGQNYTPAMIGVVTTVWALSFAALLVLILRMPYSVLDVWLMLVMVAWLFDIALAAMLNGGRFDLGFYAGRIYGLAAATFVLVILLIETGAIYAQITRAFRQQHERDAAELSSVSARLSTVLNSSPLPIFSIDAQDRIASWNTAAERIFGHSAKEAAGKSLPELQQEHGAFDEVQRRAKAGETVRDQVTQWHHHEGRVLDVSLSAAPIRTRGTEFAGSVCIAEDVTEKLKLERQFAQTQKLDAIGQLTGGIAHDFNNILTVITGMIELMRDAVRDRPDLVSMSDMIDDAAMRGAELTKQLLAFARKQPLQPRETNLNSLVIDTERLLRPTLGEQIEIECALDPDAWPALIDPGQLTNALINLAINARDAMPKGGQLTLETRNVVLDEVYARDNPELTPGPYVMVAVSDTGTGIPPDIRDKVFDPFFTTKETGKGTGLGLSMVFGFIKQSGGHIKIYSEVGHGTAVKMYLPRVAGGTDIVIESARTRIHGGSETILVVEDDKLVRDNVVMQLASLGYKTIEAANGADALQRAGANGAIDLLFTDVVMPGGMNGRELADEMARRKPDIRVLFTSGYTQNAIVHHGRLDSGVHLLGKPYRKADLARMLRVALD